MMTADRAQAGGVLIPAPRNLAVVQPLPGIGDMIWHLPHIRALSRHVGQPVTLIAKPRSAADQIFKAEQTVRDVLWVDRNPDGRRGRHDGPFGMARLIADLRARQFDAIVLLHHSRSLAFIAMSAGIPARYGYGFHLQRPFLNRPPYLRASVLRLHPFEQASTWLQAADIPLGEPEPRLPVSPASEATALRRLGVGAVRPVAIGIGSSEPYKQWGADRFAELATNLLHAGWSRLVLIGGKAEAALADEIRARIGAGADQVLPAIGWELSELAALLNLSAFYVGNDTGVMNMAAAVGIRSYGLFGGTPPFYHSSNIVPILPPDGMPDKADGMARITVPTVLAALASSSVTASR
jgi:heptosyltransferase-2